MAELLLQMKNIHKKFPGVYALKNVDFDLKSGEVHALLGENGAGKSTLIKVLGGIYRAEEGKIVIQGKETLINSVADARETGISIIHQEIMLVPNMTIAENIFMGREPTTRLGGVNYRRMNTEAQALIDGFGMNIDASRKVATLSIAQQQMVEIVKAISAKAKIVVMDEPTSSLTDTEVEHLFALIKQLKAQNIGIIYISHKLEELFRICDRITVMRDGERVGTVSTEKTNRNELIKMMVGRTLDEYYIHTERPLGDRVLEAKHIRGKSVKDGSFFLRKGEILGFAGLIGSGRSELMKSMIGIEKRTGGEVYVGGKPVMLNGISDALKVGVALVPEDRKKEGLVLKNSVGFNLTLAVLGEFIRGIHVDRSKEEKIIDQYVDAMSIKASSSRQRVGKQEISCFGDMSITFNEFVLTDGYVQIFRHTFLTEAALGSLCVYIQIQGALPGQNGIFRGSKCHTKILLCSTVQTAAKGRVSCKKMSVQTWICTFLQIGQTF